MRSGHVQANWVHQADTRVRLVRTYREGGVRGRRRTWRGFAAGHGAAAAAPLLRDGPRLIMAPLPHPVTVAEKGAVIESATVTAEPCPDDCSARRVTQPPLPSTPSRSRRL
jgi:hypothetical protein